MHVLKDELEPVAQISHRRIWLLHELKPLRDDSHAPIHQFRILSRLEDEMKLPGSLSIDAELIHRSFRIRVGVCCEPLL